jgi:hypothetical protein
MPLEESLDKVRVNRVFKVVIREPETLRCFLILTAGRIQSSVSPHGWSFTERKHVGLW